MRRAEAGVARSRPAPASRVAAAARVARAAALALTALLCAPSPARACAACFGAEDSPMIDGARVGAWVLIGVTVAMQAAFVFFFLYLRRRARRARSLELDGEWAELQRKTRYS